MHLLKGREHLVRMGGLFAAGLLGSVALRSVLVPKDFGVYGHYRAGALGANRTREPAFAGRAACLDCHSEVADGQKGSRHAAVGCEACHGALARHVANPEIAPVHLETPRLCLTCHTAAVGKPKGFKQVDPKEHFEGEPCASCHDVHSPEKGTAAKAPEKEAPKTPVKAPRRT